MNTMRKLFAAACTAAFVLTSCQEESFEGRDGSDNYYASVETFGNGTKTALGEGRSIVWSSEDRIAVFEGNGAGQAYQVLDSYVGKSSGEFAEVEGLATEGTGAGIGGTIAVYPFNEDLTVTSGDDETYVIEGITFPSEQKYIAGSFSDEAFPMTAICENGSRNLSFKNIGGVLKLSLTGSYSVSKITLTGNSGEPLSGSATVTLGSDGIPSVTMSDDASTSVTLICDPAVQLDPETATDFYISIPPTEFEAGFSVNITDSEGRNAIKNTEKQNNVCRSQILVMPAFAPPTHLFKENYYEDYDAYISEEGITMLSKKTEDGYEILIGHYDETEDSWNDDQFMVIHTDSLSRISELYTENELLRFSNYSDNTVDILHIVGEEFELHEQIEMQVTKSSILQTKSEGVESNQGSKTIEDLITVIFTTKASFELAANLVEHKSKIKTTLASLNLVSAVLPGLWGIGLSEVHIGLEKKFLGRMPSFIEGELLLVEAVNFCVEKLSDILIGPWKITNTNVIVHTAESAVVNYTVSGIKSDPSINLWGSIEYRNVTKNDHFTNISIPVTNGTHQKSLALSGPGDYILTIALNGTGGFLKRMQMHFTVPDYPMCQTSSVSNITNTSAVVECTYSNVPEDGQCQVLVSWDDGHKIVKAENREGTQSITLSSLKPNTTYSYCASIDYEGGPVNGEMKEFTTKGDCTLREQLIKLYNDTDGDNWINNENWCSDRPIEKWYGVMLSSDGLITLELDLNNLNGNIDLHGCTNLSSISIRNNNIYSINLSGCSNLRSLYLNAEKDPVNSIDISNCQLLSKFSYSSPYNKGALQNLNIFGCSSLKYLTIYNSRITDIEFNHCSNLEGINLGWNYLSSINVFSLNKLTSLSLENNNLSVLSINNLENLTSISFWGNPGINVNINGCSALRYLSHSGYIGSDQGVPYANDSYMSNLVIEDCPSLKEISVTNSKLKSIILEDLPELEELNLSNNHLTSFKVPNSPKLYNISLRHNMLTVNSLDLSYWPTPTHVEHTLDCTLNYINSEYPEEWAAKPIVFDKKYGYYGERNGDDYYCSYKYGVWYKGEPYSLGRIYEGERNRCDCGNY